MKIFFFISSIKKKKKTTGESQIKLEGSQLEQ